MRIPSPASGPSPAHHEVLRGGGEMGALMRALDWSTTAVGPVETWPQSLRTVLSILLTSRHPIFLWWGQELVQFYNDAYRPILGATKHPRALGQRGRECWTEIWDVIAPMIQSVMERGESTFIQDGLLCLDRNGYLEEAYFTYAYSPIKDESGGTGGVFVACTESTERILGERRLHMLRELNEATSELQSAEEVCRKASGVLASNPHDIPFALLYLTDARSQTPRLVGTVGLEPGGAAAPSTLEPGDVHAPWPRVRGEAVLLESLPFSLGPLPGGPWPEAASSALVLPLSAPGQDAPAGLLVAGISPRKALDAKYRGFLELTATHIANAITNARAYEYERQRAEALAALDQAKTDFFSNVSHEFRTPLTLLLGPAEDCLADSEQPLPPRQRERLEVIHRNAQRLLRLVNTLLDFSRIESGRMRAHFRPTDLAALTAELASSFRSAIERAGMRLEVDCPPLPEPVYVDREMWEQIVLNLLSNAYKFTFEGTLRLALESEGAHVRLSVTDTGTGIPSRELPHVFDRFYRVQGARGRTHEGSGIGLALVKELVRLHGGCVEARSREGQGSTFTVSLPRGSAHLPVEHVRAEAPLASTRRGATAFLMEAAQWDTRSEPPQQVSPTRLLLADDNADMRAYVQRLLGDRWTVQAVSNGTEALAAIHEQAPDLVVCDVMMPGLDGFGVLRAVRAHPLTASIPVILLSARAGEEAAIEALQAGANDYLVKPFSARELVSRVQARLEIARAHAEARTRLHTQLMQAPVPVAIYSGPELVFELANPRYLEMLGRREDPVGRPVRSVFPELPHDAPVFRMLEEVYASGRAFTADEYRIPFDRRGDGVPEDVYFQLTCQPMRDGKGGVEGIMVVATDVTVQVLARTRAQEDGRRKDEFLAMLAHELRNPLAALSTALEVMKLSHGDAARAARLRELCNHQVDCLVRMVDDLLDVSRITRGKVELRKQEVDLRAIVQDTLETLRSRLEERGHELSVTFAPGGFRLEADATRLEQVLSNLVSNAIKYTEPGGSISLRMAREEVEGAPWAVLRVRDTGRGIPRDMLERVFELFVQVDASIDRSAGGLGLGLTLVKRLVEMHGGTVHAHSEGPGKGSEFVVRLPLSREVPRPTRMPCALARPPPTLQPRLRVLVVEDRAPVRETLRVLLQGMGHEVEVATDGVEGVTRILELRPDVALVDVGLPGLDGHELARRVRASTHGASLYLVALTGYGGPEARAKALEAGFDLHLVKPLRESDLLRVLEGPRPSGEGQGLPH
ncbi:MAG TPA: ATP-binding protein [Archangium sp.]|uniref:ATP-binding protein n=1 Tax=Archangium sp. TaxID=1872627 RepID=UPI002E30876E|nr:ATP-binding protein [Archangium sp.]HEX5750274.1 ATP-binding protein [Archangium sp.]